MLMGGMHVVVEHTVEVNKREVRASDCLFNEWMPYVLKFFVLMLPV